MFLIDNNFSIISLKFPFIEFESELNITSSSSSSDSSPSDLTKIGGGVLGGTDPTYLKVRINFTLSQLHLLFLLLNRSGHFLFEFLDLLLPDSLRVKRGHVGLFRIVHYYLLGLQ